MTILAFDTTFDACSVCVARERDGRLDVLASALERFATGHAERLVPMIDAVMARAGVGFADLDRIAVTVGPGTFTGTRIGISAARGLALATGRATVGVSSLAVMAAIAADALATGTVAPAGMEDADLAIAVDVRRGEVYAQLFDLAGLEAKSQPRLLAIDDAARLDARLDAATPLLIAGSGAEAVAAAARGNGRRTAAMLPDLLPDATALARIAARLVATHTPLQPLYLRPPDAKPQAGKPIARAEP